MNIVLSAYAHSPQDEEVADQDRFNNLWQAVKKKQARNEKLKQDMDALMATYTAKVMPVELGIEEPLILLARRLVDFASRKSLANWQRSELQDWIARMVKKQNDEDGGHFSLEDLISKVTLMDIMEKQNEDGEVSAINLMTLHAAKGLEFPHVFLVGAEEDILPHHASILEDNIEEERRLCYVGITRAKRTLTITYANARKRAGEYISCTPSRFLEELPDEEIDWEGKTVVSEEVAKEQATSNFEMMRELLKKQSL